MGRFAAGVLVHSSWMALSRVLPESTAWHKTGFFNFVLNILGGHRQPSLIVFLNIFGGHPQPTGNPQWLNVFLSILGGHPQPEGIQYSLNVSTLVLIRKSFYASIYIYNMLDCANEVDQFQLSSPTGSKPP